MTAEILIPLEVYCTHYKYTGKSSTFLQSVGNLIHCMTFTLRHCLPKILPYNVENQRRREIYIFITLIFSCSSLDGLPLFNMDDDSENLLLQSLTSSAVSRLQ
jgi:hypothetical protein